MHVLIVGYGRVGRALAHRLGDRSETVAIIEREQTRVQKARDDGFTAYHGDGTDTDVLATANAGEASTVIAVTSDDDVNLLVAQLAQATFDTERVFARVNNPQNADAFEDLGVQAIPSTDSLASAIDNIIERPSVFEWITDRTQTGDVQEVDVTADQFVGETIRDLDATLPEGVLIALVSRDGERQIPALDMTLRDGDHLTFIGRRDAVQTALDLCQPESED